MTQLDPLYLGACLVERLGLRNQEKRNACVRNALHPQPQDLRDPDFCRRWTPVRRLLLKCGVSPTAPRPERDAWVTIGRWIACADQLRAQHNREEAPRTVGV